MPFSKAPIQDTYSAQNVSLFREVSLRDGGSSGKDEDYLNVFIETLDQTLQKINSDYEAKRYKNIALRMPVVHAIPKGSFHEWLTSKGKLGGQHKIPRLSNDRNWIEEMKQFMKL